MKATLDRVLSIALTIGTLAIAGVLVKRELSPSVPAAEPRGRVDYVDDWEAEVRPVAARVTRGKVSVIVFTDFECPFCAKLDSALTAYDRENPATIEKAIVHFPLPMHKFALLAARAFECADRQRRGTEMSQALYAGQSSLGLRAWDEYAADAEIPDKAAFMACVSDKTPIERIEAGIRLSRKLSLLGTPSVMVNGWLLNPSTMETAMNAVEAALDGKSPERSSGQQTIPLGRVP